MSIYKRLERNGWREIDGSNTRRYFRKGDWLAEVPNSIAGTVRFTRTHYHGMYRGL